jgi:hypothetical protein
LADIDGAPCELGCARIRQALVVVRTGKADLQESLALVIAVAKFRGGIAVIVVLTLNAQRDHTDTCAIPGEASTVISPTQHAVRHLSFAGVCAGVTELLSCTVPVVHTVHTATGRHLAKLACRAVRIPVAFTRFQELSGILTAVITLAQNIHGTWRTGG